MGGDRNGGMRGVDNPAPGISLPGFASQYAAAWFHIRTEKLGYRSQLFTLQWVSRVVYIKRPFSTDTFCMVKL